jgi:hypothetical protein
MALFFVLFVPYVPFCGSLLRDLLRVALED